MSNLEMIIRLAVAAFLGSVIGFERERLQWAAGLRTHMLVCLGSCLFMLVSAFGFSDALRPNIVMLDPSRVAAQVASGIGFLGAGTILFRGEIIKGLTTAASLWAVAAIGLASGGGLYVPAVATTAIVLIILAGIKPLEEKFRSKVMARDLRIRCARGAVTFQSVRLLMEPSIAPHVRRFIIEQSTDDEIDEISMSLFQIPAKRFDELIEKLRAATGVLSVDR